MGNAQNIGTFLKQKRESAKISIEEVAQRTKINLNILKALEANDLEKLPNKTYVKGFVKSLTKLLSINQDEALEVLEKTYTPAASKNFADPSTDTKNNKEATLPNSQTNEDDLYEIQDKLLAIFKSIFNKKLITPIVILVFVAIVLKGIISFFTQLTTEEKLITSNNGEQKAQIAATKTTSAPQDPSIKTKDENLFDLKATKNLKATISNNEQEAQVSKSDTAQINKEQEVKEEQVVKEEVKKEDVTKEVAQEKKEIKTDEKKEEKKEIVKAPADGKFPFKKFYPAPSNMYTSLPDAKENSNENLLPERFKKSIETGKENVFIHATSGDTWISYQSDDKEIKRFVLKKGRSVLIKGKVILLFMGNLNVAHIFYNNQLIEAKSKTGVKSLIFPQSQASNYELPLFPAYKGVPYKASEYKENMQQKVDS
jgi:cytoskeleton protein RodZ